MTPPLTPQIPDIFSQPYTLAIHDKEGSTRQYEIDMTNYYFDHLGRVKKKQHLACIYSRKISRLTPYNFILTEFHLQKVTFTQGKKSIRWHFAEDTRFPHFCFYGPRRKEFDQILKEMAANDPDVVEHFNGFSTVLSRFPKLPSVSLLSSQILDIIGFEGITGYFLSESPKLTASPARPILLKNLSGTSIGIGMGVYSDQSYFKNGKFYGTCHGFCQSRQHGLCTSFSYSCDASRLESGDTKRIKKGNSYYWGDLSIQVETGLLTGGTMYENVYTLQGEATGPDAAPPSLTPTRARRKATLTLLPQNRFNSSLTGVSQ